MKRIRSFCIVLLFLFLLTGISYYSANHYVNHNYAGKYISILGDSISTYEGWIPSLNYTYYTGKHCGVSSVNDTWWKKVINMLDLKLCVNNSWSGSRVTATVSAINAGCVRRCVNLHREGIMPDLIIVYMGINDFDNNIPVGTYDGSQNFPKTTMTFREAYAIMLKNITTTYPDAEVYVCTLPYSNAAGTSRLNITRNKIGESLYDYNTAIEELADLFQVNVIDLANCGISSDNMQLYLGDYSEESERALHPNKYGHSLIANTVLATIAPEVGRYYITEPIQ